jgi:predicted phage tail protein
VADTSNGRLRRIQGLENTPPVFDSLFNVTVPEDTPAVPIVIDFGDSETATAALVMTASSSRTRLVPSSGLVLGPVTINQFGGSRTLTITPQPDEVGTTVITLTLVDTQGGVTRRSFNFTTTEVNDPPTLGPIADIIASDAAPFSAPLTVGDIDGPDLNISAASSNQAVIPNANLAFDFDGTSILIMTPIAGVGGQTTITVTLSDGSLSVSRSFVATVVVAPQAPVLTSAVIDGMVAELQWTAAASGITPLTYRIEAGTTSGATDVSASIAASARRFALLLPATGQWFVRVRAVSGVALSLPSDEIALNVTGVPGRPRNLTASVAGNLVTFRWTLPTNGTRTAYRLDAGTASGLSNLPSLVTTPSSTALFVNATAGTTFVRLVAVNSVGSSTPSNEIRLVVGGPPGPPAAPSDVQVGIDGATAVFHWASPATGGVPSQFVLDAGANTPGQFNLVSGIAFGAGFTFAASAPPGTYNVRLRAANAVGSSAGAGELFVTLPGAAIVPSAPALLRANVEPSRLVTLAWTPPFAGVATSYLLEAGTAPGLANLVVFPIGAAPGFQVVAPPGTYFVRVRAVSSAGVSGVSNELQVVVP